MKERIKKKRKVINSCGGSDVSKMNADTKSFKYNFVQNPKTSVLQHFRITDIKQIMGVKGNTADATEIKWSIQYGH